MTNDLEITGNKQKLPITSIQEESKDFVTMRIENQLFGIPVSVVRDILVPQDITFIPLAPPEVLGILNLRGRVVTAVDIKVVLDIKATSNHTNCMNVVVEHKGELYSMIVDQIGDVVSLSVTEFIRNPENLSKKWQDVSIGIYMFNGELLIVLDVEQLLAMIINR